MAIRTYLAMTTEEIAAPDEIPENAAWMLCPFSDEIANVPWKVREHPFLVLTDAVCPESAVTGNLISKICALEPKQVLTQKAALSRGLVPEFTTSVPWENYRSEFVLPPTRSTVFFRFLPGKAGEKLHKSIQKALSHPSDN